MKRFLFFSLFSLFYASAQTQNGSVSSTIPGVVQAGGVCGGNVTNPSHCAPGLACIPSWNANLPLSGICTPMTTTLAPVGSPSPNRVTCIGAATSSCVGFVPNTLTINVNLTTIQNVTFASPATCNLTMYYIQWTAVNGLLVTMSRFNTSAVMTVQYASGLGGNITVFVEWCDGNGGYGSENINVNAVAPAGATTAAPTTTPAIVSSPSPIPTPGSTSAPSAPSTSAPTSAPTSASTSAPTSAPGMRPPYVLSSSSSLFSSIPIQTLLLIMAITLFMVFLA